MYKIAKYFFYSIILFNTSLFGQDNIINQIAPGGKFVVRDTDMNEFLAINKNEINFSGNLTIDTLSEGASDDMYVLWNPIDKKLKVGNHFSLDINNESPFKIQTSINATDSWTELNGNIYRATGNVGIGTSVPYFPLDIKPTQSGASILLRESDSYDFAINFKSLSNRGEILLYKNGIVSTKIAGFGDNYFFGNVGIGTTNPSSKLDVAGQVKITGGNPGIGKVLTSDALGLASWESLPSGEENSPWFEDGDLIYREIGNVGIGTTNPSSKLDVAGQVKITGGNPGIGKVLTSDALGLASWESLPSGEENSPWFEDGDLIYREIGNVGIGTTNPSSKLDVAGQVKITGGNPGIGKVLTSDALGLASWESLPSGEENSPWFEDGDLIYREIGNVGIGTTNPSSKLDVAGQVKITGGNPGIGKVLTSDALGLASWESLPSGEENSPWFEDGDLIYREIGNVGIGTNSPGEKLTVSGIIETESGGIKFPDGTIQTTAAVDNTGGNDSHSLNSANDSIEDALYVNDTGKVGIGTTAPSGVLELNSVTGALIVPRMTTSQREQLPTINGSIIYNIETNEFNFLENDNWSAL